MAKTRVFWCRCRGKWLWLPLLSKGMLPEGCAVFRLCEPINAKAEYTPYRMGPWPLDDSQPRGLRGEDAVQGGPEI